MKNQKKLVICILIIVSSLGIFKIFKKANTIKTEIHKNNLIKDHTIKLKECFDLENKNQRTINESLDLIKYCMKEFRID